MIFSVLGPAGPRAGSQRRMIQVRNGTDESFRLHQVNVDALCFLIYDCRCSQGLSYFCSMWLLNGIPHDYLLSASWLLSVPVGPGRFRTHPNLAKKIKIITKMRYAIIIRSGKLALGSGCCRNTSLTVRTLEC